MKRFIALLFVAAVAGAGWLAVSAEDSPIAPLSDPKVIYGSDDRIDLYQIKGLNGSILRRLADSTVALMNAGNIKVEGGIAKFQTTSYQRSRNLCADEPFAEQETAAFCSGSLVAADIIATAGHCVTSAQQCAATKFVFGFAIKNKGDQPRSVPAKEVYGCAELIGSKVVNNGEDWALVRLDRRVENHQVLQISRNQKEAPKGTKIFVIGHPAGLPTKIAGGASVRDASPKGYFVANLDTYGGNSGSAVFNAASGNIEGILVRGEQDYEERQGQQCTQSKRCSDTGCRGEDVTKISVIADKIPMRGFDHLPVARISDSLKAVERAQELGASVFQN